MKYPKLILLLVSKVAVCTCQLFSQVLAQKTPASSSKPTKSQYIFGVPKSPIHLAIAFDQASSASAAIGPSGGKLSATGVDETKYSLEIPANAWAGLTRIKMTPLVKMTGMPFDGKASYGCRWNR